MRAAVRRLVMVPALLAVVLAAADSALAASPPGPTFAAPRTMESGGPWPYAVALGECQYYVRELPRIIDRLTEGD